MQKNGDLSIVYKGSHSNHIYTAWYDGDKWQGDKKISDQAGKVDVQSDQSPSAAVLNNNFYIFFCDDDHNICTTHYSGAHWSPVRKLKDIKDTHRRLPQSDPKSKSTPRAISINGHIHIIYSDAATKELWHGVFDGQHWTLIGAITVGGPEGDRIKTGGNPGLAFYDDTLYIFYIGKNDKDIYVAWGKPEDGWNGDVKLDSLSDGLNDPKSKYCPCAITYMDKLYVIYKGEHKDFLYTIEFDGTKWTGNTQIKDQRGDVDPASDDGPQGAVFDDKLYIIYRGSASRDVYWASYDGDTWDGDTKIDKQDAKVNPETNYNPGVSVAAIWPRTNRNWMSYLDDSISIADINMPGSHEATANAQHLVTSYTGSPYACQNYPVDKQLEYGARIIDIRVQVEKDDGEFKFTTCHSENLSSGGFNLFITLKSALDMCSEFLEENPSETVVIILKIESWYKSATSSLPDDDRKAAYTALENLLGEYETYCPKNMPNLSDVRGKMVLYNRISERFLDLGINDIACPLHWSNNTAGSYETYHYQTNRSYSIWVQDQYKGLPNTGSVSKKTQLVTTAMDQKTTGKVVLNFASATWYGFGVYINAELLGSFGEQPAADRYRNFGWILFDYGTSNYGTEPYNTLSIFDIIVDSNFSYRDYPRPFRVPDSTDLLQYDLNY